MLTRRFRGGDDVIVIDWTQVGYGARRGVVAKTATRQSTPPAARHAWLPGRAHPVDRIAYSRPDTSRPTPREWLRRWRTLVLSRAPSSEPRGRQAAVLGRVPRFAPVGGGHV